MKRTAACALPLATLATLAWAIPLNVQPGFWEITTRIEVPGVRLALPPQTVRRCYTRKDVETLLRPGPQQIQNCEIRDQKIEGNRVSWKMDCRGTNAMTGTGNVTVSPTSFQGTIRGRMIQGGATMEMNQAVSGRRIGDCT